MQVKPEVIAGPVTMQCNAMSDSNAGPVPLGLLQEIPLRW